MADPYDVLRMALISCRQRLQNMQLERREDYADWARNQAEAGFNEADAALENPAGFKMAGDKAPGMPASVSINEPLPMDPWR